MWFANVKSLAPSLVIWLLLRIKKVSLQLECVSAEVNCFAPSSVIWFFSRDKLFSLQFVCVSATVRCLTPSVILLSMRRKSVSLQLVCVNAVTKWWTPLSVIGLKWTVKLLSWLCSLPQNNLASSIHPSDWRLLAHKSKSKIPSCVQGLLT